MRGTNVKRKKMSIKEAVTRCLPRLSNEEVEQAGDRVWKKIEAELEKRKDELAWRSIYGDGWSVPPLDEGDLQIMTAVQLLGSEANGDNILHTIREWTEHPPILTLGLDRLEAKGLLKSTGTGDQWKRYYQVTKHGEGSLHRAAVEGKQVVAAEATEELPEEGSLPEKAGG
jgi:DNA-binding PadR family transcriptional regulator